MEAALEVAPLIHIHLHTLIGGLAVEDAPLNLIKGLTHKGQDV